MPVNPSSPDNFVRGIVDETSPASIMTQPCLKERAMNLCCKRTPSLNPNTCELRRWAHGHRCKQHILEVTRPAPHQLPHTITSPLVPFEEDALAYVIFTSGSSGKPKGVEVTHQAVQNTCREVAAMIHLKSEDVCFGLSSLSFDLSVFDIFGPLSVGAKLVLCGPEDTENPHRWKDLIREYQVTLWNSVPMSFHMLIQYAGGGDLHYPRAVLLSGDWIPVKLASQVYRKCRLICLGGATEAAIWSNFHEVTAEPDQTSIPYGRALPNQSMMVLDEELCQVPDGQQGEIHIGGLGLARGYFKDLERTRAAFIWSESHGALYKTGDFGRYLPNGEIEFLGRQDSQIKRSGFRVELNHISAVVEKLPWVARAVATANKDLICWVEIEEPHWSALKQLHVQCKEEDDVCLKYKGVTELRWWRRRSYREFLGKHPSVDEVWAHLADASWANVFRSDSSQQFVDVEEVSLEVEGYLLELLSEQCIDGQCRYAYASAGAARAVTTWLMKYCDGWKKWKYLRCQHGLSECIDVEMPWQPKELAGSRFVLQVVADLTSTNLQRYDESTRTSLMKQEIGFMKAVLDEAAKQHGWTWQVGAVESTEETVVCMFALCRRCAPLIPEAASSATLHFFDFVHNLSASFKSGAFVLEEGPGFAAHWDDLRRTLPPHNQILAEQSHWMLELEVDAAQEGVPEVALGKLAQLVMMIPVRCKNNWGWCPVYRSGFSMLLLGGPLAAEQVHWRQAFWSEAWAVELCKRHLEAQLPKHFHPDKILLRKLPLSKNGKVDFALLCKPPQPEMSPSDCIEQWLQEEILKVSRLNAGYDENLVQSGMKSQEATALARAASRKFELEIAPIRLYEFPSIRKLATFVRGHAQGQPREVVPVCPNSYQRRTQGVQPASVTGMSLRSPRTSLGLKSFWEAMCQGADQVGPAPTQRISLGLLERQAGLLGTSFGEVLTYCCLKQCVHSQVDHVTMAVPGV